MRLSKLIALVWLGLVSWQVFADDGVDLIQSQAHWIDRSGQAVIEQATQSPFESFEHLLAKGYSRHPIWIKVSYKKVAKEDLILRILPTYLDEVTLYQRVGQQWMSSSTGDRYPFADRDNQNTALSFNLHPQAENVMYLRLQTTSTSLMSLEVVTQKHFSQLEGRRDTLLGIYFGALIILMVISTTLGWLSKQTHLRLFALFEFFELLYASSFTGYMPRFVLPGHPLLMDLLFGVFVISHIFTGILFHRSLLKSLLNHRIINWTFNFVTVLYLCLYTVYLFYDRQMALSLTLLLMMPCTLIFAYVALFIFIKKPKISNKYAIASVYAALVGSILFAVAPPLGLINSVEVSLYASLLNGFVFSILMFILLLSDLRYQEKQLLELEKTALVSDQEIAFQRSENERQSKFMAMLSHELKTPLAVIKLAIDSDLKNNRYETHANKAISDLNQIIDRSVQMSRLDQGSFAIQKSDLDMGELIQSLLGSHADRFELDMPSNLRIQSDPLMVQIILGNLIENALKYSNEESRILIEFKETVEQVTMTISNLPNITGMPASDLVFDKFYRNTNAQHISGSGLGLYLVKALTEMLNGSITYEPKSGWVKFILCFPK
uniref:sensor histidine kinase n=1 Tax=Polynucleobacter sp. TaxID=2029855 RepID=UPI0040483B67